MENYTILNSNNQTSEYDFFISFSVLDLEIVSKIVDVIENTYHAKCWFQEKDSKAEFIDAIMDGIEKSKAFLVFISPNSANSYFVLNEINYAIRWKQENEYYSVLPIVIDTKESDLNSNIYKRINFYLGRINMLFMNSSLTIDELVLKIFNQTGIEITDTTLYKSLYHSSENEAKRLKAQNDVMKGFSKEFFSNTVKPDYLILDIGCAGGNYIMSHLQELEYQGLLGVDLELQLIEEANEHYGSDKNLFVQCDALSNDFDNVISDYLEDREALGFDLIHISAVLLHLTEPVRLLRILRRYLRKNGYLFIQDEDDGANIIYPNSRFFDLAFKIWADSKESGDRHCARKIPGYLKEAGYTKISLAKCGIANSGLTPIHRAALWDIYFNYHLWLAVDENIFYHVSKTNKLLEEYKLLYPEYKKRYDNDEFFVQLGFYFYIAQK